MKAWVSIALVLTAASLADVRAEDGVWSPEQNFTQVNVACARVYTCGPAADILHDAETKLVPSAPKLVWGVCSAGSGATDSCNECGTNPPSERCEWHLEKK